MIPKIIHYCWFGRGEMPKLALQCIESWHMFMPDYEYKLWNEGNFDVTTVPYTKEAYEAKKFAFVSDYVRLWALNKEGGIYFDVDFKVLKSFDDLLHWEAFAGFEGSKYSPLMMGVIASQKEGQWVQEQLGYYQDRHFVKKDGSYDLTTNVEFVSNCMRKHGFLQNGKEQEYKDLHVFPVDYFCPMQTTGEFLLTKNTYCYHLNLGSWSKQKTGWKSVIRMVVGQKNMSSLIKLKRKLLG